MNIGINTQSWKKKPGTTYLRVVLQSNRMEDSLVILQITKHSNHCTKHVESTNVTGKWKPDTSLVKVHLLNRVKKMAKIQ